MNTINKKYHRLQDILQSLQSAVLAFSGGVDSTFLLWAAKKVLGENLLAVTFKSEIIPQFEIEKTKTLTAKLEVQHLVMDIPILNHKPFIDNDKKRCYHCKKFIFSELVKIAENRKFKHIIEGSNADDAHDFRPGRKALQEMNILSPLSQAGLTKKEIRKLSRKMGLSTWNKPPLPCLATRVPYGTPITKDRIKRIEQCEQFLREKGFKQVRVRDHGYIARIEIPDSDLSDLLKNKKTSSLIKKFKDQGFTYICVDMEGYRSGSMNEVIKNEQ